MYTYTYIHMYSLHVYERPVFNRKPAPTVLGEDLGTRPAFRLRRPCGTISFLGYGGPRVS